MSLFSIVSYCKKLITIFHYTSISIKQHQVVKDKVKMEQKNQRRRELYQLKKAKREAVFYNKKEAEHKKYLAKRVADMIMEFNWKGNYIPKYFALWKAVWDNYE